MITQEKIAQLLRTEKLCSILTCEKYRQKQIKKCDASDYAARFEIILAAKTIELEDDGVMTYEKVEIIRRMMVRSALTIKCLITLRWVISNKWGHDVTANAKLNGPPF